MVNIVIILFQKSNKIHNQVQLLNRIVSWIYIYNALRRFIARSSIQKPMDFNYLPLDFFANQLFDILFELHPLMPVIASFILEEIRNYDRVSLRDIQQFLIMTAKQSEVQPWYRADKEDNFDVRRKILRSGCRDVFRGVVECRNDHSKSQALCESRKKDYEECLKMYKYLLNSSKS